MVLTAGTPIETAATSSSRSAIQARPSRESRSRKFTNSTIATSPSAVQYHGLSSSDVNGSRPGNAILSTGVMPCLPAVMACSSPKKLPSGPPRIGMLANLTSSKLTARRPMISPNASVTIAM